MLMQKAYRRRQAGLSLVELMIAIVAGLIVIGAALTFIVSSVRAYGENIRSTRLSQELRTGMNLVARELRRAGYDGEATSRVMTDDSTTLFRNLAADSGCVIYQYERDDGISGNAATASEKRAIRFNGDTRTLQMLTSDAGSDCSSGAAWKDMTDPRVISITGFDPQAYEAPFCVVGFGRDTNADGVKDTFDITRGSVTSVSLCLKGSLASDGSIVRQLTDTVRVRADKLEYASFPTKAAAESACAATPAPTAPPTSSELNESCADL